MTLANAIATCSVKLDIRPDFFPVQIKLNHLVIGRDCFPICQEIPSPMLSDCENAFFALFTLSSLRHHLTQSLFGLCNMFLLSLR